MPPVTEFAAEDLDRRLGKARDLLDGQHHRARNGVVSLLALVAVGVSATLLFTLVFGAEETPAQAQIRTARTSTAPAAAVQAPAAFELSASELPATDAAPAKAPVLVATEK